MEPQVNMIPPAQQLTEASIQNTTRRHHGRRMKSIFTTGIFQIIGGTIMILCGFVLVCIRYYIQYRNTFDNTVCGIWSGGMVLMTGIVGVFAANRPGALKGIYMCMSLVALCLSLVAVIIGAVAAADNVHYYKEHPGYHHYDDPDYPDQHGISITKLSFHLLLCFVGSTQLIICILAAVFCCTVICPGDTVEQTISYNAYAVPPNYAYPPPFSPQPFTPQPNQYAASPVDTSKVDETKA